MAISALLQGTLLGCSMIIPIGVQNSFILSQGIKRNHHLLTASICLLCHIVLTVLGIFGGGELITSNELLMLLIGWGGITFLVLYASRALYRAWRFHYSDFKNEKALSSRKTVIVTTLALTLLNPHVYLDTVVILGSVGSTFIGNSKVFFTVGAILAAVMWFYCLAVSAAKLAPWLAKPSVQRSIDIFIGLVMYAIAYKLFNSLLV
jgi:L-lysine exporter family protein LysE/ArgO